MTSRSPAHRYRDAFTARMHRLYRLCRAQSMRCLAATCKRLPALYPGFYPDGKHPTFSVSTFSKYLNRKRAGLPEPDFVTAFFLCCRVSAREKGVDVPSMDVLREWHTVLRAYEDAAHAEGLYVRRGYRPIPSSIPTGPVWHRNDAAPHPAPPAPRAELADLVELSAEQHDSLRGYGPYGQDIVDLLDHGDADACYRGAILLSADPFADEVFTVLLTAAVAVDYHPAVELMQASIREIDRFLCRALAETLATSAQQEGDVAAAEAFGMCAARLDALMWGAELPVEDRETQQDDPE